MKKYKYPPEEAESALEIVLKQCEEWTDDEETEIALHAPIPFSYYEKNHDIPLAAESIADYNTND